MKDSQSSNGSTVKATPASKLKRTHEDANLSGPIEAHGTKTEGLDTSSEDDSEGDTADKPLPSLGFSSRDGLSRTNSSNKVQARSSTHSGMIAQDFAVEKSHDGAVPHDSESIIRWSRTVQ